jgi:hypothetical protein
MWIFMTKKNCIELARALAMYSVLYESATTDEQRRGIVEDLDLSQLQVLDAFLEAKGSFIKKLKSPERNHGGDRTDKSGNRGDQRNDPQK